eukprot:gnl/TRDRNA2_/TRDRNA2_39258_c0_seq1.p1 gnl/TRDRNA2_/TRDRNA2_39258_c0~~gnl/TRDRNA2_/TRDRNA2_39258_c0_seq1.p1  ORF type:complete len:458 (+),score=70.65 gnl/TRDRNA2_/TRDRNA2_39258_c0_seq1:58-1431(+)
MQQLKTLGVFLLGLAIGVFLGVYRIPGFTDRGGSQFSWSSVAWPRCSPAPAAAAACPPAPACAASIGGAVDVARAGAGVAVPTSVAASKAVPARAPATAAPVEVTKCSNFELEDDGYPNLKKIVKHTRKSAAVVPTWITKRDHRNNSLHGGTLYGLPPGLRDKASADMGPEPSEIDMMLYMAHGTGRARYLEIGAAIGKTFWMGVDNLPANALAVAFTLERPNPTFANVVLSHMDGAPEQVAQWNFEERDYQEFEPWITLHVNKMRKPGDPGYRGVKPQHIWGHPSGTAVPDFFPLTASRYRIARSQCGAKTMYYIHGDEFDKTSWDQLEKIMKNENAKFNIIFADAYKHGAASTFECENLVKRNLIDFKGPWAYFWDDGLMNEWCRKLLQTSSGQGKPLDHLDIKANGWLGQHEFRHPFGLITNMDTTSLRRVLGQAHVGCSMEVGGTWKPCSVGV